MCGIVGYIGHENAVDVLLDGLKRLEYRGYDSAGITILKDNDLLTVKSVGKIANLEKKINDLNLYSNMGIGHTRWATHGIPNETNCHPHCAGSVMLVHNGIIENYIELKRELIENGYNFRTQTDTEVAAAYIDYLYDGDPIATLDKATKKFRGSYALAVTFSDDYNTLYGVRKGSPLVLGVSGDGNFIASDIPAFLKYTNQYIELDEDTIAKVTDRAVKLYKDSKRVPIDIKVATWTLEDAEKGGYDHFMLKEMHEQPVVLDKINAKYTDDEILDISKYKDIHIIGCGSAYHAALIGKYLINNYANTFSSRVNVNCDVASEYRYSKQLYNDETLVVLISQSGETADTLACLKMANDNGVDTLAIVNVQSSSIAKQSKYMMPLLAGPEIAVATSKGYFAQVALLSKLTLKLCETKKTMTHDEITTIKAELKEMSVTIKQLLLNSEQTKTIADGIYMEEDTFFIGRGIDYAIGLEASLKLKEISYINSTTYQAGELKHGAIALVNKGTPVIAICTDAKLYEKTVSNIKEVNSRGAHTIIITTEEIDEMLPKKDSEDAFYQDKIVLPNAHEFNQALSAIIPLQMLAYEIAKNRNCDIDKPKNLAKSVTVE